MKKIFILLCFILGCISPGRNFQYVSHSPAAVKARAVVPIWIDVTFSNADKEALGKAIAEWNYVLNGHVRLRVVSQSFDMSVEDIRESHRLGGWLILKIKGNNPRVADNNWLAFCNEVGGRYMYIIRDRLTDRDVQPIMLHEIGHLLGAGHVGYNVMHKYYAYGRYNCVDRRTAETVALSWHLRADQLNYCVPVK
jgi:hypothetical protein